MSVVTFHAPDIGVLHTVPAMVGVTDDEARVLDLGHVLPGHEIPARRMESILSALRCSALELELAEPKGRC